MMPLVSIVIPACNAAPWLADCLRSAVAQTWQEKEIVVVDDGSTDGTLGIARSFSAPALRVFSQENRGASSARNRGLREARGDFLQFLDADDLLAPDKLEKQFAALADRQDAVACGSWGSFRRTPEDAVFVPEPVWASLPPVEWLVSSWSGGGMMHPAAWLVPRAVADRAGLWDETLSLDDDGEYFARVVLASRDVRFAAEARSYYRNHDGQRVSRTRGEKAWSSSLRACESKAGQLLARENSPRTRRACAANFSRFAWENYPEGGDYVRRAVQRWLELDASVQPPRGGPRENLLARCFGWRIARRLRKTLLPATASRP